MNDGGWAKATICDRIDWSDGLFTLKTDAKPRPFDPGQHLSVGVDNGTKRIHRLFSIASSPAEPLEFLVVRVEGGELSPRLDALADGGEMWVGTEAKGGFVLDRVPDAKTLWMFATGAGLAPYVSMLRTETPWKRFERIVLVHGIRRRNDAAYRDELARLSETRGGKLRQVFCITRQQPAEGMLAGRVTEAVADGRVSAAAGEELSADTSQVLLCGNPEMIRKMTRLLEKQGFRENGRAPGNITTERYW